MIKALIAYQVKDAKLREIEKVKYRKQEKKDHESSCYCNG